MKTDLHQKCEHKNEGDKIKKKSRENPLKVKLSKLIISKFESTNLDWLRY